MDYAMAFFSCLLKESGFFPTLTQSFYEVFPYLRYVKTMKYPPVRIFHVQNSARCDGAVYAGPGRLGVPAAVARHSAGVRAHPGGGGGGAAAYLALLLLCGAVRAAGTLAPRRLHLLRLQTEHRHLPPGGWSGSGFENWIRIQEGKNDPQKQCSGPMTFWCRSGSADPCL
jgi:hypothetical protein